MAIQLNKMPQQKKTIAFKEVFIAVSDFFQVKYQSLNHQITLILDSFTVTAPCELEEPEVLELILKHPSFLSSIKFCIFFMHQASLCVVPR